MCIPKTSENKLIAERYIEFMLHEEPAIANAEYTYYASPNKLVRENEGYIEYMNEIKDDAYEKMYGTDGIKTTAYANLSNEKLALINNLWEELKSDIDVSPVIIVTCVAIVCLIIFSALFFSLRKKHRNKY
jgi:spermidine/putrescine-binding protein